MSLDVGLVVYGGIDRLSGGYRYDRKLAEAFREEDEDVTVVAIEDSPDEGYHGDLRSRLEGFDVLIEDELAHAALPRTNRRLSVPVVALVHHLRSAEPGEPVPGPRRELERRFLSTADAAICVSEHTREAVLDLVELPTVVAPPAGRVGGAALSPDAVGERSRSEPFRVAFVGSLSPRKGPLTLLDALAEIDHEWRLDVVGDRDANPAYARRIEDRIEEYGIGGRLRMRGAVSDDDLESILATTHVLAVPSRYEGFGMVFLEAMEYGVVPVAGDAGATPELIENGRNGLLVPPGEPAALREAIAGLAADRERLAALGRTALGTAGEWPEWSGSMGRVRSFIRERVAAGADRNRTAEEPRPEGETG